jgi:hypothetical protein
MAREIHLVAPGSHTPSNPIEGAFSKLKTFLRRVGARTREALARLGRFERLSSYKWLKINGTVQKVCTTADWVQRG